MSCKGKTPKGVRGGRVSWREQMTPAWSKDPSKQPGGLGSVLAGKGQGPQELCRVFSLPLTFSVTLGESLPPRQSLSS